MSFLSNSYILVVYLFAVVQIHFIYGQIGCTFSYKTDLAEKEPVLLSNTRFGYKVFEPTTSEIKLKKNEEIVIACPGGSNKISGLKKDLATAKCVGVKTVAIDGKQTEFSKIGCEKKATGQCIDSTEPCGKKGIKKYIGHKVNDKFYPKFYVCYDQKNGQTLFSKHTLQGVSIEHDKQGKLEGNYKIGGLDSRVKPEQIYSLNNLKKIFTNLLGTEKLAKDYINDKNTLVRSQLSPKSDFILATSQCLPYFYINSVPQWQSINSGNWKTLESTIRKFASELKEDLKVITGTHEVLTLKDKDNNDVEIYLDEHDTLPVPKYVWKIVYSSSSQEAIAFVNYNNPFVKSITKDEKLCTDVCNDNGWGNALWKQSDKGLVYCCDVEELMEQVDTIPDIGEISGILNGKVSSTSTKTSVTTSSPSGCELDYKTDFPEKAPILLKKSGTQYEVVTLKEEISLQQNEEIVLFCSGASNAISKASNNFVSAKCVSGSTFKVNRKNYSFKDLGCSNKINPEYKLTKNECVGKGLMKKLGHKYDDKNFVSLIDVCYDHKQGIPLYSEHTLHGAAINNAKPVDQNIDYKVAGLDFRISAEEDYKTDSQKQKCEKLLESKDQASKYINSNSYFARAHLSPAADFVFTTSKYSSYFYVNAVPQWQTINNGNWKTLENAIRTTASNTGNSFDIITGTFGILSLKNAKGKDVEIYLGVLKTLPVPKYLYKVMYCPQTKKGIAFVSLNNPYLDSVTKKDYICPNVCKNYGWDNSDWDKKEKGLIYCCEIKDLKKVVDTVPEVGEVKAVQEFKKN